MSTCLHVHVLKLTVTGAVTLALTYAADVADGASVFIRPIRNDSYLIRNVHTYKCIIHRARKIRSQALIIVKITGTDEKSVMIGNSIRICPYVTPYLFRN